MLPYLSKFAHIYSFLNIFKYITLRTGLAILLAFFINILLGPWLIKKFSSLGIGENTDKTDSRELAILHENKKGTPTMGGILLFTGFIVSTVLTCKLENIYVLSAITIVIIMMIVGFIDDYIKLYHKEKKGIKGINKLILQTIVAILIYITFSKFMKIEYSVFPPFSFRDIIIPFFKRIVICMGGMYILWCILVITSTSNAVNLADGLDGLATGACITVFTVYLIVCYIAGRVDYSHYLYIPYIKGIGELTVVCGAIIGALLGFLWFNCYPASIFMGDTGSLPLGALMGFMGLVSKHEFLLIIAGGIFVVETMSVILQVISFKLTGKRLFKIAPIHHHFQLKGINETKITVRFWIINIILALISIATLKVR